MQDSVYFSVLMLIAVFLIDALAYNYISSKGYIQALPAIRRYALSAAQVLTFLASYLFFMYLLYDRYVFNLASVSIIGSAVKALHIVMTSVVFGVCQPVIVRYCKTRFSSKTHAVLVSTLIFVVNTFIVEAFLHMHEHIFPPH